MHENLRRRALESGKTVSNKAKSKPTSKASSRANSQPTSRVNSRLQSRDASDDEDLGGNLSDDTNISTNSIDEVLEGDEYSDLTTDVTNQELLKAIENLLERKGSSVSGREETLASFDRCLTAHYLPDSLTGRTADVLAALEKLLKPGATEKEATLAVRGLALIAITVENDELYETVSPLLRRVIQDSEFLLVKAAAINTMAICLTFGGAGEEEIADTLVYLLQVISSDGDFVGADGNADTITAALTSWGFLATFVSDLEDESEDTMDVLLDQLDADDVRVQIAAGENIALLYEKSYGPKQDDDESEEDDEEDEDSSSDELTREQASLVKRYDAFHNKSKVLEKLKALASLSTKSMSRKDKRQLHQSFAVVASSVESPRIGLSSLSASKMTVRIHSQGEMKVDKWWKLMRLNTMRRVLAGGFVNHYLEGNKQLLDMTPMIMRDKTSGLGSPSKVTKQSKGRYRSERRFVSVEVEDGL
jgi:hypothetical protein